jgi:hypothetical protein
VDLRPTGGRRGRYDSSSHHALGDVHPRKSKSPSTTVSGVCSVRNRRLHPAPLLVIQQGWCRCTGGRISRSSSIHRLLLAFRSAGRGGTGGGCIPGPRSGDRVRWPWVTPLLVSAGDSRRPRPAHHATAWTGGHAAGRCLPRSRNSTGHRNRCPATQLMTAHSTGPPGEVALATPLARHTSATVSTTNRSSTSAGCPHAGHSLMLIGISLHARVAAGHVQAPGSVAAVGGRSSLRRVHRFPDSL